ncbi:MAG: hypothetical protein V8R80_12070 [Eubacterium sp.]
MDQAFRIVKDTYRLDENKTILSEEVMLAAKGETIQKYDSAFRYIEMTLPLMDESGEKVIGVMLVSVSTDNIVQNEQYLKRWA